MHNFKHIHIIYAYFLLKKATKKAPANASAFGGVGET